jgi:hypothetical protein
MYGLPQAGIIAQELLEEGLKKAGYSQSKLTQGYWKHEWRPISSMLVVDDCGIKYIKKTRHASHQGSKEHSEVKEDWESKR